MKILNLYAGIGGNRKLWLEDSKTPNPIESESE
jgi:hypothetical protein